MLKVGDVYYWYGVDYAGSAPYAANPSAGITRSTFKSVTCYSSTDLAHWKSEGNALSAEQTGRGWFGRLGVVFNAKTKKYVLIAQGSAPQNAAQRGSGEYFATSDTPTGPFKFAAVQSNLTFIANGGTGDQTVFSGRRRQRLCHLLQQERPQPTVRRAVKIRGFPLRRIRHGNLQRARP